MFAAILVAGRWAGEKYSEAISPQAWTRDMAAEYVADTLTAVHGQWAPNNRNRSHWGQQLSAAAGRSGWTASAGSSAI